MSVNRPIFSILGYSQEEFDNKIHCNIEHTVSLRNLYQQKLKSSIFQFSHKEGRKQFALEMSLLDWEKIAEEVYQKSLENT